MFLKANRPLNLVSKGATQTLMKLQSQIDLESEKNLSSPLFSYVSLGIRHTVLYTINNLHDKA